MCHSPAHPYLIFSACLAAPRFIIVCFFPTAVYGSLFLISSWLLPLLPYPCCRLLCSPPHIECSILLHTHELIVSRLIMCCLFLHVSFCTCVLWLGCAMRCDNFPVASTCDVILRVGFGCICWLPSRLAWSQFSDISTLPSGSALLGICCGRTRR
jgi:hypothetical protein